MPWPALQRTSSSRSRPPTSGESSSALQLSVCVGGVPTSSRRKKCTGKSRQLGLTRHTDPRSPPTPSALSIRESFTLHGQRPSSSAALATTATWPSWSRGAPGRSEQLTRVLYLHAKQLLLTFPSSSPAVRAASGMSCNRFRVSVSLSRRKHAHKAEMLPYRNALAKELLSVSRLSLK